MINLNNSNVKLNCIKKVCNYFFRKIMIYMMNILNFVYFNKFSALILI